MRIVTWNVQGMARNWRARRASMIGALRPLKPDVVALQECAWRFRHQSMQLAGPLGMKAYRAGTLGLLSRVPVRMEVRPLPAKAKGGSKRALLAEAGGFRFLVLHLPLDQKIHVGQAEKFISWAREKPGPFVLCGDMNERPTGASIALLLENGFRDAWTAPGGETWPSSGPRFRLDFVLVHGTAKTEGAELLRPDPPASDHLGLMVDLRTDQQ